MGERLQRLWPSLVALVGTVAVVVGLLWMFGGDVTDSTPDDAVAGNDGGGDVQPDASPSAPVDDPSGDPEPTDPEPTGESPPPTEPSTDTAPTTPPPELREPVGIANQTSVNGLAEYARERLEEGGWDVPAVSTFNGTVPETTVYYPPGMEDSAEALAAQFPEIGRIQPTFEGLNPSRLVVVLVEDYLDEVGRP